MLSQYCLIVNEGEPYRKGEKIPLSSKPVVLGRSSSNFTPDISFTSPYISRRHAKIIPKKNRYYLSDSDSTHGTMLNNKSLVPVSYTHLFPAAALSGNLALVPVPASTAVSNILVTR